MRHCQHRVEVGILVRQAILWKRQMEVVFKNIVISMDSLDAWFVVLCCLAPSCDPGIVLLLASGSTIFCTSDSTLGGLGCATLHIGFK